jgi:N-acetylneuraminate synthase
MTIFVAELCVNHLGSLNLALKMIEEAARIGCDYVKLHRKDVDTFYTPEKLAQPYASPFGKTWGDYRRMFEFSADEFWRIDGHCQRHSIGWFATAQDRESLEFLLQFDLPLIKIASCNARNESLIRAVTELTHPDTAIVLSVGGSTLNEIGHALSWLDGREVYLLHCVAEYPCEDNRLRLGNIPVLKNLFERDGTSRVGFSSHEIGVRATYAALGMDIAMLERHFALSRHSFAHGIECAIEPEEYAEVIRRYRAGEDLKAYTYPEWATYPFTTGFGMSDLEWDFLIDQKYGVKYIPSEAHFDGQR